MCILHTTMSSTTIINFTRLLVSDRSGRLIWAPYPQLAGSGLGMYTGQRCTGWHCTKGVVDMLRCCDTER